ncbi:hypothetical protein ACO0RG_000893 [Hanseniaspora osmophila]
MSSKRFDKANAQKFSIVHRPHDDPRYYDSEASEHILLPLVSSKEKRKQQKEAAASKSTTTNTGKTASAPLRSNNPYVKLKKPVVKTETQPVNKGVINAHAGEAALYGIQFDDSKYDYTQHLKPIGLDPENSVFIAKSKSAGSSSKTQNAPKPSKKDIADMFTEDRYKETEKIQSEPVFKFGMAKPEYLEHQVDIAEDLKGFKPDMDPALREILEALEDDAYVINEDVVVDQKKLEKIEVSVDKADGVLANIKEGEEEEEEYDDDEQNENETHEVGYYEPAEDFEDGDDDIFAELLGSGEAGENEAHEVDEWDIDNYEDDFGNSAQGDGSSAAIDLSQFDDDLSKFNEVGWGSDMSNFKKTQEKNGDFDNESNNDFDSEFAEDQDQLGDMPSFDKQSIAGKSKSRKQRRKKGAMSDTSGFSMSSSAIARTEVMTVLDDKFDQVIDGYQNYEEEQEDSDYEEFDMSKERSDLESMLDDFLDNYELASGGRKIVKKCEEKERLMKAADSVSKGKLSMRRRREQEKQEQSKSTGDYKKDVNSLRGITGGLNSLKF